ncbi:uncharacterized protein isoform X2 [Choristoneura fumiferana]|uniref:uncharacterized protein isoform X2 n=1 Tax=Choristoneura fumiferana TaxID=7141 RepID=UPI003D156156
MPDQQVFVNLALEFLEDNTFNDGLKRNQKLEIIQQGLQSDEYFSVYTLDRILAICINNLKDSVNQSTVLCLHIIATILKRVQDGPTVPNLLPSAEAVLQVLQTSATLIKAESLQTMCFNTFLDYPNHILISLVLESNDFWELFNLYCSLNIPKEIALQPINIILKLLKILTPDKKTIFVKKGLAVWFSKIVPCVMFNCGTTSLEALEMLTEELVKLDYSKNPHWLSILDNIYNPNKYPAIMKNMLVNGIQHWQRLWIIFIKLLEDQITTYRPGVGSPINSMLPVVENAFKLDITNRCRAFQCWKVLIDVFSAEINEQFVTKRIKLLLIPLKLNNAKVEETALAKLDTWWHLIKRYESRIDDSILYPFLHFCFGKHVPDKMPTVPGLISPKMQESCVKAFVELVGHVKCEGCGLQERLKGKLITTKVLVNHWNDWVYSLKMAIQMSGRDDVEVGLKPISCAWKSFVMTIAELPDNNIRKDLFYELLALIKQLAQECHSKTKLADIIVNVLITSLFEEDAIKPLLKIKEIQNGPLRQLLHILTLIKKADEEESSNTKHMKMVTEFMANMCPHLLDETVEWLVNDLQPNDTTLELWTALSESLQTARQKDNYLLHKLLRWPIKHMKKFKNAKEAAQTWASTFSLLYLTKESITNIDVEITSTLERTGINILKASSIALFALLSIIKASLLWEIDHPHKMEMLLNIVSQYSSYNQFDQAFPLLMDTLNLMVSKLPLNESQYLATAVSIMKKILSILNKELKENKTIDEKILIAVNTIKSLSQTDKYVEIINRVTDELLECRTWCKSQLVQLSVDFILNSIKSHKATNKELREKNKEVVEIKEVTEKPVANKNSDVNVTENLKSMEPDEREFTTPVPRSAKKNSKKRETNIVNTVVENGEEFAVIQSNWKFNPRKLTENQKEKLQRKREDIPALYQDLSQSQDEFKLKSWKADSQDASTTNSRSASTTSNEDLSTALKNISDTNIVPKIISNFFSESPNSDAADKIKNQEICSPKSNVDKTNLCSSVKTPRMALKDRVFRNVRNLIEKSTVTKDSTQKPELLNQTVSSNIFNTPLAKCRDPKVEVNSAPSKISADRPARVKRKPKKFDDTELFLLKKRRNSANPTDSQSSVVNNDSEVAVRNTPSEIVKDSIVESNKISNAVVEKCESDINDPVPESQLITDGKNDNIDTSEPLDTRVDQVSSTSEKGVVNNLDDQALIVSSIPEAKPDEVISCSLSDTSAEIPIEEYTQLENNNKKNLKDVQSTPKLTPKRKDSNEVKSTNKKKSRIEKELAIDMVEGHPFLKLQSEKRVTRKCLTNTPNSSRRKNLTEKLNKSKTEAKSTSKPKKDTYNKDLLKEKCNAKSADLSITVCETQDLCADGTQDLSEDIIESSQDSTTTISVKSYKNSAKKTIDVEKSENTVTENNDLINNDFKQGINTSADVSMIEESKDDTDIPANKTDTENVRKDLTEEMDTQPTDDKNSSSGEVILINEEEPIIVLNTEDTFPGPDTLELANADTEPVNPSQFVDNTNEEIKSSANETIPENKDLPKESNLEDSDLPCNLNDRTVTLTDITQSEPTNNASSPSRDEDQRKKDFLNNTLEISPIRLLSPIEPKSPSPETSGDFLIIKLSGPIQMNGEPLENSNSPEILTEEKSSPDKRDQSPPRVQVTESKSSPSSSLSLKKNRPQVRAGGRAAQMLGLCVPDRTQSIMSADRPDTEEPKKNNSSAPVRRNLRMLYSSTVDSENLIENDDSENFLKFEKVLPPADCSPAGPILKRKLAEISDEATVSPANKRKRVSFHDPVSTSVSVQKYIETSGVRSPQQSALRRLERQMRNHSHMKSPKRLENLFKLDSILVKTVESFTENDMTNSDTQISSLEQTPAVEIVKTSELNDTDPIFPDLIDCKDSIHNIASELSSPAMKLLLVKELEDKIETVGDLAKLTELEVNRLCIKAPKVPVVKKVLGDYLCKKDKIISEEKSFESVLDKEPTGVHAEVQTSILTSETETQTSLVLQRLSSTQTDSIVMMHKGAQTEESGSKSTEDMIKSCLQERKDFVYKLSKHLDQTSIRKLADCMLVKDCTDILVKKMTKSDTNTVFNRVLQRECELHPGEQTGSKELSFLLNYLCDKFDAKDLILFCSQMLQKVHDKST